MSNRLKELTDIFKNVEEDKRTLVEPLIEDIVELEAEMAELRKLPQIKIDDKDNTRQKKTAAAKQLKEVRQSYYNALRILLSVLNKIESTAASELLEALKEFE